MNNTDLSFEPFDYEKVCKALAEGKKPLPDIMVPVSTQEKPIIVAGFLSEDEARERLEALNAQCPSNQYQIIQYQFQTTIPIYAIVVPELARAFLKENEKVTKNDSLTISYTSYSPFLYRFVGEKEHEDKFFESGELLISSFSRCKSAEVKERRDIAENQNRFIIRDGANEVDTVLELFCPALLLCTSLSQKGKRADGNYYEEYGFKILDPDRFVDVLTRVLVSKGIPVKEVVLGPCVYNNKKIVLDASGTGVIEKSLEKGNQGKINFQPTINYVSQQAQNHILLNKPPFFSHENEYRFVWKLTRPIMREEVSEDVTVKDDGSIIVRAPELIPFCQRLGTEE